MTWHMNKSIKILCGLFLILAFFVCAVSANVAYSDVSDTNVYGSTGQYDISVSPVSSTSSNIVHISNEYLNITGINPSVNRAVINQNITLTPVDMRGAVVYLDNSTVVNGFSFDYGSGGHSVGDNPYIVSYDSFGDKVITLTLTGWDGTATITKSVNTTIKVSYIDDVIVGDTYIGAINSTITHVSVTSVGTLDYQWFATTTPNDNSSWSDRMFTNKYTDTATFNANGLSAGKYYVKVIVTAHGVGSEDSYESGFNNTTITVVEPIILSQPTISLSTTIGTDVVINGSLNNNVYLSIDTPTSQYGTLTYQWYEGDVPLSGLTGLTNQHVSISDTVSTSHNFTIHVYNWNGTVLLNEIISNITSYRSFIPPVINSVQANNTTVIFNYEPTVNVTANMNNNGDNYTFNWQYNKNQIGGWHDIGEVNSTSNSIIIDFNTSSMGTGTYYIRTHVYGYGGDTYSAETESSSLRIDVVGAGVITADPLIGDINTEIHLHSTAQSYSSLTWYMSKNNQSYTPMSLSGIDVYYTPTEGGYYKFMSEAIYGTEPIRSNEVVVQIYAIPSIVISSPYVVVGSPINLIIDNTGFNTTTGIQWQLSSDGITYNDISTSYESGNRTQSIYSYTPLTGSGGEYYVKAVLSYVDERGLTFSQNVIAGEKLFVYETPTISVSPLIGNASTTYMMSATNTNYGTITWTLSQNGESFYPISEPLTREHSTYNYRNESLNGAYAVRGEISWVNSSYIGYTNVINITVYGKPETPIIQSIPTVIESQTQQLTLKLQDGYVTPAGEDYTYYWNYQKDNGIWSNFATTHNTNTSVFSLVNKGAGTYNFTVNVSGTGGTSSSAITTAYVIGINSISVSESVMDFKDLIDLSAQVSAGSSTMNVHWYASTNPTDNASWSDTYISNAQSLSATFGNSESGVPSGNYTFKLILNGAFGTLDTYSDGGIQNVSTSVYRIPIIDSISVTRCIDEATPVGFEVNVIINSDISIAQYKWEYSARTGVWVDMNTNASSGTYQYLLNTTRVSPTENDVDNYNVRVSITTSEGYVLTSENQPVSVVKFYLNLLSESSIAQGTQIEATVSAQNLIPSSEYSYMIQISENQNEWTDITSRGTLDSIHSSKTTSFVITSLGQFYLRVHAWNNGTYDYYTYSYPQLTVLAPLKFTVTSNVSDGITAGTIQLNVTNENGGSGVSWKWQQSINDGNTWSDIGSVGTTSSIVQTTSTANILTLYRVIGSNGAYSNVVSNVVGYLYHTSEPITSASDIATSSADKYTIPTKTWMPYEIIDTYSLSSVIGLVVTQHALYLVDVSNNNASKPSVISTLYLPYGTVKTCKYYNGHLMYQTADNRIIVQNIVGASGFGTSIEIRGYSGTATDYDMSKYNYMVAVKGSGISTYDVNGVLQWFVQDTTSDSFAMTKVTTDNNLEYAIIASNTSSNVLKAYSGQSRDVVLVLPNNINKLYAITYDSERIIVVTNTNTLVCSYSLTVDSTGLNTFTWGNYVTLANILNNPSSVRSGSLYTGTMSRTLYIYDSNGNKVGEYPTSDSLTASDIAKLTGDYVMTGGNSGQVSILQNTGGGWEGMQSVPLPTSLRALSMSDSANTFLACTATYVFCGVQGEAEESGTVLTTTYYLKISVTDSFGNSVANTGVKVVSSSGTNLYTTDSSGSVTIEVIPTKTYTISLPNGEDTVVYTADNYALQYVTLRYPSTAVNDKLTYGATLRDNRYVDVSFANAEDNPYNVVVTIYNGNKSVVFERTWSNTLGFTHSFDTNSETSKTFIVNITADPSGNYENHVYRTYVLNIKNETSVTHTNSTGTKTIVLGDIPLIPTEMDEKWRMIIFGGLIMIISALFSYNHSRIGCVMIAIIAGVMTYFGILPLNPVWVGCMIFLAILTVYSFAAQNEG